MADVVGIIPDTDTTGRLVYQSDIPYLGLKIYDDAQNDRGTTKYSGLIGITGFTYNFSLDPPANNGLTFGLSGLLPDTVATVYAVPYSGLTDAYMLIASDTTVYMTDNYSRVAVAVADDGCIPSVVSGLRYNSGYWYAYGSGSPSNFGLSSDGVFWKTPANNPYLTEIYDIAFDPTGMGVAIGTGPDYCMSLLLDNKVWMPVLRQSGIFDRTATDNPELIIFAKKWFAFGRESSATSYNGIEWESLDGNPSIPYSADYDSENDVLMVATDDGIIVINVSDGVNLNVGSIDYPVASTTPLSIRFNGTKWILTYSDKVFTADAGASISVFVEDTNIGSKLNADSIAVSAPPSLNAYLNTVFLSKAGSIDIISGTGDRQQITSVPTSNLKYASSKNDFPYGPSRVMLDDPAVGGVVPSPTYGLVNSTLTFVPERLSSGKIRCTSATAHVTNPLPAFKLKFNTDEYSPKNFKFTTDTDTYELKLLESTNDNPFVFSTTTNQSNESKFNFINDGVLYSQIYQSGKALSTQLNVINEIFQFFEKPEQLPEIDTAIISEVIQEKFFAGETLYNANALYSYSMDDIMSINNFSNVSNPAGVINGSTSYEISSLTEVIEVADSHNFNIVKTYLAQSANTKQNNYSGNPFEDPTIEARFENLVDNAIRGKNASGYIDISEPARNEMINTVRSHSTIESLITTDYFEKNVLPLDDERAPFIEFLNGLYNKPERREEVIDLIDRNKASLVRPVTYTSSSEFEILFDGNVLTFLLDSEIIQQYLVLGGLLRINMNFDSFNTLFNSTVPSNYAPSISFNLDIGYSILQQIKNTVQTAYFNIEYPNRQTYLNDLARVTLTRTIYNSSPIVVEQPAVINDYFYMISQYSNNPSLVSRCLNKFNEDDPYTSTPNADIISFYNDLFAADGNTDGIGSYISTQATTLIDEIFGTGSRLNDYNTPNPTSNYMLNEYYLESYNNILGITLTYNQSDFIAAYSNFIQFTDQNRLVTLLKDGYDATVYGNNPVLPVLPSRNLFRVINDDLMNTYTTSSVLNKLGGSLILNKTNVFSNDEIFNDGTSAASEILGFLNAGASLSSYLNDPTLNVKLFSLIIDQLGIQTLLDAILQQAVSNTNLALNFLNRNELSVHIPDVNHESQSMAQVIWDNFYKFSSAQLRIPNTTITQSLSWADYNNNLQYIVPGTTLVIDGVEYESPIGTYIPLIGI